MPVSKSLFTALATAIAFPLILPASATAAPARALRFDDLEATMRQYQQFSSALPNWQEVHTPTADLKQARGTLQAALPVGLAAADARDRLRAAGGQCALAEQGTIVCTYADVRQTNEFIDHVAWKISVPVVAGRVADITVARDWYRS